MLKHEDNQPPDLPGAEALAQGLEKNSWLEELDLSENHIKMLGAMARLVLEFMEVLYFLGQIDIIYIYIFMMYIYVYIHMCVPVP